MNEKVYRNASIHLENLRSGVCDLTNVGNLMLQYFTIKCQEGIVATSFPSQKKFYIDPAKLLPLERFLPKPKGAPTGRGNIPNPISTPALLLYYRHLWTYTC